MLFRSVGAHHAMPGNVLTGGGEHVADQARSVRIDVAVSLDVAGRDVADSFEDGLRAGFGPHGAIIARR